MNAPKCEEKPGRVISGSDRKLFREVVGRYAEIARSDVIAERIRLWKKHNSLRPERPMLLVFPEGSWGEIFQNAPELQRPHCQDPLLASMEWPILSAIYAYEHFQTDNAADLFLRVPKTISNTGWGLAPRIFKSSEDRGAWKHDPVVLELSDLKKLRMPDVVYDEKKSMEDFELVRDLVGDLIEVRSTGMAQVSFHLMSKWAEFRGLEEIMMDMVENPEWTHEAIGFLAEGNRRLVEQYEKMGLLELNNDNTYHSTGGNGWTDELPAPGFTPGHVRPIDMWVSAEVQELTMVSPGMHEEFALRYERELIEPFGLAGYGCCDDLTLKIADVLKAPNMRRISISPYADVDRCAPQLGSRCIFSWKPRPTDLVGEFHPEGIRKYIRHTLEVAAEHHCVLEMILKDTHTCEGHIERFDAWCKIAREEVGTMFGGV